MAAYLDPTVYSFNSPTCRSLWTPPAPTKGRQHPSPSQAQAHHSPALQKAINSSTAAYPDFKVRTFHSPCSKMNILDPTGTYRRPTGTRGSSTRRSMTRRGAFAFLDPTGQY